MTKEQAEKLREYIKAEIELSAAETGTKEYRVRAKREETIAKLAWQDFLDSIETESVTELLRKANRAFDK